MEIAELGRVRLGGFNILIGTRTAFDLFVSDPDPLLHWKEPQITSWLPSLLP